MYIGTLEPVSNNQTWKQLFEVIDDDTDEAFDISAATSISIAIADHATKSQVLSASLSDGRITRPGSTGVFQLLFSSSEMAVLNGKTYDIGIVITVDSETSQLLIGKLPVIEGIVT